LLANLCELQRRDGVTVLVVHHARRDGGSIRAGQALRGSSKFPLRLIDISPEAEDRPARYPFSILVAFRMLHRDALTLATAASVQKRHGRCVGYRGEAATMKNCSREGR
jgi:hypothetical protein